MVVDGAQRFEKLTPTEQESISGLAKHNNLTPLFPKQK